METRCVILCAGEITPQDIRLAAISPADFVIAADAGWLHAKRHGIRPDLILGDFDSSPDPGDPGVPVERFPVRKDDTDSLLALRRGLARGCRSFVLLGALGGAADHTLANLQALAFLADHGARGQLVGQGTWATLLRSQAITLPKQEGYLSVFAVGGPCRGVTLRGTAYPLEQGSLSPNFPLGVSNRITAETATVAVEEGDLLVMVTNR